jgi:hypothetical protein
VGLLGKTAKAGAGLLGDVKDLMFLHGTSPEKLSLFNEIGGLPMPSMAVTQKDIPFSWGDIDLIGKPDNFNPATNSLNDLYSADAYTIRGKDPFKIPNKDAWKTFSDEFDGYGSNAAYLAHKLANSSSKKDANPEAYRMMSEFFEGRNGGGYKKFAEENNIDIPIKKDGRQNLVDLKYDVLDNHGAAYKKWSSDKLESYFKPEWNYLDDKNKVKLYDADAMTKLMKKNRGQGTEGVEAGEGYERAMEARKFKSLDQAKKNKNLLLEKKVADQKYSEMDYQDLPPTSYFESKPARTVGLNEFGGAIVPEGVDARTLKILEDRGIPIERYADDAGRLKARDKFQSQMFTNPAATMGAGLLGAGAMMGSEDADAGILGKATGLLMDYSSRMARAKEQGYDVNTPYFHGTKDGRFQEFNKSGHGELGKGVYLSKEYKIADDYSRPQYGAYRPEHGGVKSLLVKGDMAEIDRQEYLDLRSKYMDQLRADNGGEWEGKFYNKAVDMVEDYYKKQGYVGLNLKNPTLGQSHMYDQSVVFDTKNIRSPNAAFDPAKTGSSNLLASNPVATTSAGLLGLGAAAQSNDTYADYSPSNLARLQNDDVGSYQAAQSPQLARAAGLMGQVNKRGVDDPLMGFVAPRIPSELMDKIAYNDRRGITDYLKASAGLIGLY